MSPEQNTVEIMGEDVVLCDNCGREAEEPVVYRRGTEPVVTDVDVEEVMDSLDTEITNVRVEHDNGRIDWENTTIAQKKVGSAIIEAKTVSSIKRLIRRTVRTEVVPSRTEKELIEAVKESLTVELDYESTLVLCRKCKETITLEPETDD